MELMFPATQTAPPTTGADDAPSLADIVHEQTQGGRLIVDFLAQAALGGLPDFKPCHRLQASDRLIKLESSPEFTGMVREHTRGGDLISQFLISAVMGRLPGFQPCHRMEAIRQLAIINPKMARALTEDNTPRRSGGVHTAAGAPLHTGAVGASLEDIARQETNDGRDIVRFYADVMRGDLTGFKSRERMDAAKELLSLWSDHSPCLPAPQPAPYPDTDADTPDPVPATTWKDEWDHFEYPEDRTYDFSSYDEDDYRRDVYGDKALVHIFGDDEAKSAANQAVLDYKVDQIEAQRAAVNSEHDTCQPADPPACPVPRHGSLPRTRYGSDSFGRDTYGYNALVFIYDSEEAARVGYTAAMAHKEKLRLGLIAADQDLDHLDNGPGPPPRPPPKPRALAHFGLPDD